MHAIEFDTSIHRGIVHIPLEHLELCEQQKVRVHVMIEDVPNKIPSVTHATKSCVDALKLDRLEALLTKIHTNLPPEIHPKSDDELRFEALRGRLL